MGKVIQFDPARRAARQSDRPMSGDGTLAMHPTRVRVENRCGAWYEPNGSPSDIGAIGETIYKAKVEFGLPDLIRLVEEFMEHHTVLKEQGNAIMLFIALDEMIKYIKEAGLGPFLPALSFSQDYHPDMTDEQLDEGYEKARDVLERKLPRMKPLLMHGLPATLGYCVRKVYRADDEARAKIKQGASSEQCKVIWAEAEQVKARNNLAIRFSRLLIASLSKEFEASLPKKKGKK